MTSPQLQFDGTRTAHRVYRFGRFELETRSGQLRRNGFRVRMQEQPRRILSLLLEHAGDLVTREDLHRTLWPADTFVDFDIGLNAAIRKLRMALGDRVKHPQFIETFSRRGYRFVAPVALFEVDATQPPSQLFPAGIWLTAIEAIRAHEPHKPWLPQQQKA
jgi:DNA-binding winged helix-turn-helix (wHTH) protein